MIKQKLKKQMQRLAMILLIIVSSLTAFNVRIASAKEIENPTLIPKISKDFTKKYCNSIAFGLSKESAINFSLKENNQVFNKRKGYKNINKELLAEEIGIAVVEKCGYPINLSGERGILGFQNYYLSKDQETKEEK